VAKEIERRLAALEERTKAKATREIEYNDRDTARRIHFVLMRSRRGELEGAPLDPAAVRFWRLLQPNDVEKLDSLREDWRNQECGTKSGRFASSAGKRLRKIDYRHRHAARIASGVAAAPEAFGLTWPLRVSLPREKS
jgi:hypothetical protein